MRYKSVILYIFFCFQRALLFFYCVSTSSLTCFAVGPCPALHAASVSKLITHVVAKVVVAGTANFVALAAIVVFVAAHADGVLQAGDRAFVLHRLLLLPRVDHPFVDAALDQQLVIWTKEKQIDTNVSEKVSTDTKHHGCLSLKAFTDEPFNPTT